MNHRTLPPGYRYACTMDFLHNRRQMTALLKLSALLTVAPLLAGLLLYPIAPAWAMLKRSVVPWLALAAMLILYIPLHELTHGAAMFALSGVKPVYGLKLPYAYAGSTAWFDRRSHIATALAPVVLWGIALQIAIALAPAAWAWPLWIVQISNLSGSAGDITCAWALARMPGDILIQDTGVRMRVMKRTATEEESP